MTPVIVATQQGVLANIWYRDSDGGLHQAATVLVGDAAPAELAQIASDMNERFTWGKLVKARNGHEPEPPRETKEQLNKRQIARRASLNRLKRTKEEIAAFDEMVLGYITAHPGTTIPEITEALLPSSDKNSQSNVRAGIARLMNEGRLAKDISVEQGQPHRYSAAPAEGSLGESGGHGGPNGQPDESLLGG